MLSHAAGVGEPLPAPVVRLMMALKLASLAQGASGVRLADARRFSKRMLARDLIPVVPGQGSVGASGDLAPLAHMTRRDDRRRRGRHVDGARVPAAEALARAGLAPLALGPKEGLALLNGTQFSTAYALAGLFEAERAVPGRRSSPARSRPTRPRAPTRPSTPRIHALRGHRGQIEAAAALRALMAGSAIRASHLVGDDRVQDPYCLRCQPQVMGAVPRPAAPGRRDARRSRPTASPTIR